MSHPVCFAALGVSLKTDASSPTATRRTRRRSSSSTNGWRSDSGPTPTRSAGACTCRIGRKISPTPDRTSNGCRWLASSARSSCTSWSKGKRLEARRRPLFPTHRRPRALRRCRRQDQRRSDAGRHRRPVGNCGHRPRACRLRDVKAMPERVERSLHSRRTPMMLAVAFGAVALLLASVGIYGVLAYQVARAGARSAYESPSAPAPPASPDGAARGRARRRGRTTVGWPARG